MQNGKYLGIRKRSWKLFIGANNGNVEGRSAVEVFLVRMRHVVTNPVDK